MQVQFCIDVELGIILRREHRPRMFTNRVLRWILGPKRGEIKWGSRRLYNEELHNLNSSPNIITMIKSKRMRWKWHVACIRENRSPYKGFGGKPEGKTLLWKPRRKWEANVGNNINLKEIGWGMWSGMMWLRIGISGGPLRTRQMNFRTS
jgi:hypothetical protein